MDERRQSILKQKVRVPLQEVLLPSFPDDDETDTKTITRSRRVSFGTNLVKEFIVGSAVSTQCVSEYEQAFSSSDSSAANSSRSCSASQLFEQSSFCNQENQKKQVAEQSDFQLQNSKKQKKALSDTESSVNRGKGTKFSSTICFSADSPTADMEFTEGCISLAKSIFDKKKKDITVIIQAKPKEGKQEAADETLVFESSDVEMSITKCAQLDGEPEDANKEYSIGSDMEETGLAGRPVFLGRPSRQSDDFYDQLDQMPLDTFDPVFGEMTETCGDMTLRALLSSKPLPDGLEDSMESTDYDHHMNVESLHSCLVDQDKPVDFSKREAPVDLTKVKEVSTSLQEDILPRIDVPAPDKTFQEASMNLCTRIEDQDVAARSAFQRDQSIRSKGDEEDMEETLNNISREAESPRVPFAVEKSDDEVENMDQTFPNLSTALFNEKKDQEEPRSPEDDVYNVSVHFKKGKHVNDSCLEIENIEQENNAPDAEPTIRNMSAFLSRSKKDLKDSFSLESFSDHGPVDQTFHNVPSGKVKDTEEPFIFENNKTPQDSSSDKPDDMEETFPDVSRHLAGQIGDITAVDEVDVEKAPANLSAHLLQRENNSLCQDEDMEETFPNVSAHLPEQLDSTGTNEGNETGDMEHTLSNWPPQLEKKFNPVALEEHKDDLPVANENLSLCEDEDMDQTLFKVLDHSSGRVVSPKANETQDIKPSQNPADKAKFNSTTESIEPDAGGSGNMELTLNGSKSLPRILTGRESWNEERSTGDPLSGGVDELDMRNTNVDVSMRDACAEPLATCSTNLEIVSGDMDVSMHEVLHSQLFHRVPQSAVTECLPECAEANASETSTASGLEGNSENVIAEPVVDGCCDVSMQEVEEESAEAVNKLAGECGETREVKCNISADMKLVATGDKIFDGSLLVHEENAKIFSQIEDQVLSRCIDSANENQQSPGVQDSVGRSIDDIHDEPDKVDFVSCLPPDGEQFLPPKNETKKVEDLCPGSLITPENVTSDLNSVQERDEDGRETVTTGVLTNPEMVSVELFNPPPNDVFNEGVEIAPEEEKCQSLTAADQSRETFAADGIKKDEEKLIPEMNQSVNKSMLVDDEKMNSLSVCPSNPRQEFISVTSDASNESLGENKGCELQDQSVKSQNVGDDEEDEVGLASNKLADVTANIWNPSENELNKSQVEGFAEDVVQNENCTLARDELESEEDVYMSFSKTPPNESLIQLLSCAETKDLSEAEAPSEAEDAATTSQMETSFVEVAHDVSEEPEGRAKPEDMLMEGVGEKASRSLETSQDETSDVARDSPKPSPSRLSVCQKKRKLTHETPQPETQNTSSLKRRRSEEGPVDTSTLDTVRNVSGVSEPSRHESTRNYLSPEDLRLIDTLQERSREPGCLWSITDMKAPHGMEDGVWCFAVVLLECRAKIQLDVRPSDGNRDAYSAVVGKHICLERNQVASKKEATATAFGYRSLQDRFIEESRKIKSVYHVEFFLDKINSLVSKLNNCMTQILKILKEYPGSRLLGRTLSFRLYSFPFLFSSQILVDLEDFPRMSRDSLAFETHFGNLDESKIKDVFDESLRSNDCLVRFIISCTRYIVSMEREHGGVSRRDHVPLLPPELLT